MRGCGGGVPHRYTQSPENYQSPCKPLSGHISGLNIPTIFPGIPLGGMYK